MSCEYIFILTSNDKGAGHTPYAWLRCFLSVKSADYSEQWVQCSLDKFTIHWASAVPTICLNLSAVLTVRGSFCCFFATCLDSHVSTIHVILFCHLIGAARIQAAEVNSFTPPVLPGSFLLHAVRGNEPGYEATITNCWCCLWVIEMWRWEGISCDMFECKRSTTAFSVVSGICLCCLEQSTDS